MPATAQPLIGREGELETTVGLLDEPDGLPGAIVLHGAAGVGKTSILLAGLEAAADRRYRLEHACLWTWPSVLRT